MDYETEWDCSKYKVKANLFGYFAKNADKNSSPYRIWCFLYFEFLARAALAKIHPVLMADPSDAMNILYPFGVSSSKPPKSIPAKTIYVRCRKLIPGFDENALKFSQILAHARNKEFHSGESGLQLLKDKNFRPQLFRTTKILCNYLDEEITDFFNEEEVKELEDTLQKNIEEIKGRADTKVKKHREKYESLNGDEKKTLVRESQQKFRGTFNRHGNSYDQKNCPACKNLGTLLGGRIENIKREIFGDNNFQETTTFASQRFICFPCGLDLNREELEAVNMPISFKRDYDVEPADFIDFDSEPENYLSANDLDQIEPDYGND